MAVTDAQVLAEIQRVTLEGTGAAVLTWPSGMWSAQEVLDYLNQRQNRFLAACGLFWTVLETPIVTGQTTQPNPADWLATLFVAIKSSAGVYRELPKLDAFELDLMQPTWPADTTSYPRGYYETDGDTLTLYVAPTPTDVGSALERYYLAKGPTFTGLGVNCVVSDEFVPTLKYGVLADMFGKVGPAQTLSLAAVCEARWQEGLELAALMTQEGWFAR